MKEQRPCQSKFSSIYTVNEQDLINYFYCVFSTKYMAGVTSLCLPLCKEARGQDKKIHPCWRRISPSCIAGT
jgi:hypothetical protein